MACFGMIIGKFTLHDEKQNLFSIRKNITFIIRLDNHFHLLHLHTNYICNVRQFFIVSNDMGIFIFQKKSLNFYSQNNGNDSLYHKL